MQREDLNEPFPETRLCSHGSRRHGFRGRRDDARRQRLPCATTARWLDLEPRHVLMVMKHSNNLRASSQNGLPTTFMHRPGEWGDMPSLDPDTDLFADLICEGFDELANQLGCPA
jgi:hypothetical protein